MLSMSTPGGIIGLFLFNATEKNGAVCAAGGSSLR